MAELKGEIDNSIVIVGNFNILLSIMKRINRQDQQGIRRLEQHYKPTRHTNIYRTLHPTAECTLLSIENGTLSRIDHTLGHKTSLNKFKKIGAPGWLNR